MKNLQITLRDISRADSISAAIEEKASESDWLASGVIGQTFACSGPGSGWQQNFDVSDYAARALDDECGATHYIDSADGRVATLDADGDVEWTDDSMVTLVCPSIEDAFDEGYRDEFRAMVAALSDHDHDAEAWGALRDSLREGGELADLIEEAIEV